MRKCKFEAMIDDYLMNHLSEEEKEKYEEHYFNCAQCFEKMEERAELIYVVKSKGDMIFEEERHKERQKVFSLDRIFSSLTIRQWAYATAAVALMLVVFLAVLPVLRKPSPQFTLEETSVLRGEVVTLLSPLGMVERVPSRFSWKKVEGASEYRLYLYAGDKVLWKTSTEEKTAALLPPEIVKKIDSGKPYTWKVKAFSSRGTLMAASSKNQFTVFPKQ
ncbi:MAG: hypothetical protein ACE5LC_00685 [Candidatus Aminicenantales bacterium]